MTAIAAVYTPEGFVIAADGLRRDGETLEPVSDCAQKIFWGAHPNFVFAYAWTGTVGLRLPTGEFVSLIDVANQVIEEAQKQSFASTSTYVGHIAEGINNQISAAINMEARLLLVGYFLGAAYRMELWFEAGRTPELKNLVQEPLDFGIFSGSAVVFKQMHLTKPPSSIFEGAVILQSYLQRCIDGCGVYPDCAGFGGRIHMASVGASGHTWIIPPKDINGPTESECDEVLRRMLNSKPLSKAEISARIKAERETKKAAKESR
jgi:hypothetical protein